VHAHAGRKKAKGPKRQSLRGENNGNKSEGDVEFGRVVRLKERKNRGRYCCRTLKENGPLGEPAAVKKRSFEERGKGKEGKKSNEATDTSDQARKGRNLARRTSGRKGVGDTVGRRNYCETSSHAQK